VGKKEKPTSPSGAKELVPNVSLVVFHVVFFEERQELFLKRMLFVMFLLFSDVFLNRCDARFADAEYSVAGLPSEV